MFASTYNNNNGREIFPLFYGMFFKLKNQRIAPISLPIDGSIEAIQSQRNGLIFYHF